MNDSRPELLLVVDDDPGFGAAVARVMRGRGHEVEVAADGSAARTICLREQRPIMAIVDLQLGEDSGIDTIAELRLLNPLVRAVLVSSYLSVSSCVLAMRAGAIDCLPKHAGLEAIVRAFVAPQTPAGERAQRGDVPSLAQVEWEHIQRVVHDCGGNLTAAAERLRIPRRSLQRKLRRHSPR